MAAPQSSEKGTIRRKQTATTTTFEPIPVDAPTGQAVIITDRMKSKTELEKEAGAARVARAQAEMMRRPPVVKSEAELRAEPTNTPVFRPNIVHADRVTSQSGSPVSQHLGSLMRKVGSKTSQPTG